MLHYVVELFLSKLTRISCFPYLLQNCNNFPKPIIISNAQGHYVMSLTPHKLLTNQKYFAKHKLKSYL